MLPPSCLLQFQNAEMAELKLIASRIMMVTTPCPSPTLRWLRRSLLHQDHCCRLLACAPSHTLEWPS
eukprot:4569456-Karenia_brevis.AAC.1